MRTRDLAMAQYLLDRHAEKWDGMELGRAMMWAAVAAPDNPPGWLAVIKKITTHPIVNGIDQIMVQQSILQAAKHQDVALARFLLALPQVAHIEKDGWDAILMETLPKGHPYKRVIETRDFTDVDGNPEIQEMVDDAMARSKKTRPFRAKGLKPS